MPPMVVEPKNIKYKGLKANNNRDYYRLNERIRIKVQQIEKPGSNPEEDDDLTAKEPGKVYKFFTQDISAGGMQFFAEVFFRENSYMEVTLIFKESDPPFDPVTVTATVIRTEQVQNSRYYNISAMFVGICPKDRCHIERYIFLRQREMIAEKTVGFL